MTGPGDLYALAQEWLQACSDALDSIPGYEPDLVGAPTRQFVSFAPPALDCCDQLAVHSNLINEMDTTPGGLEAGRRAATGGWLNQVELVGTLTRCVPDEFSPPVAVLNASSRQLDADGWALWNRLHNLIAAGQLLERCGNVVFGAMAPLPPSGGCAGWTVRVRVRLDGYDEVIGT